MAIEKTKDSYNTNIQKPTKWSTHIGKVIPSIINENLKKAELN